MDGWIDRCKAGRNAEYIEKDMDRYRIDRRIKIRLDPVFLGHLDPDPDPVKNRILSLQTDPCEYIFSRYIYNIVCLKYRFGIIIFYL